jgi:hypothetical protein
MTVQLKLTDAVATLDKYGRFLEPILQTIEQVRASSYSDNLLGINRLNKVYRSPLIV